MSLRMMRHPHERHRMIIVRRRSDRERTGLDGMGLLQDLFAETPCRAGLSQQVYDYSFSRNPTVKAPSCSQSSR
jgi:hypothetical protein